MAQAEKEMLIPYNPAAKATPPKAQRKEPDYYQPEQIDRILEALDTAPLKWRTITYLLIDTGCRRGEAMGLKWESVDLSSGVITIERALLYSSKHGVYEGPPKNGKARTVKLAPETVALLKQYRLAQLELRFANGDRWIDSGYVFTQDNGNHMNPDSITDWLGKFSAANGLPHIHPHAFRHTAASTMIASGVDLVTTANELGHSNATTTATIYAHQISEAKAKANEARSSVFNRRREAEEQKEAQA
jgi:integrase